MSNPFLKKNPFMSMWLSAANRAAGSLRGQASAQAKRQVTAAVTQAAHDNLKLWTDAMAPGRARAKTPRKP